MMVEHRSANRVSIAAPGTGALRVLQDVVVGRVAAGEITVASADPIPRGEHVRLEVHREHGPPWAVVVCAHESWTEIDGDRLSRCVRLHLVRGADGAAGHDHDAAVAELSSAVSVSAVRDRPLLGSLIRRIPIRLVNLSLSGCLFESPLAVGEGTVGFVEVAIQARRRTEAIRIRRLERREGRVWPYRSGAEFLTFTATGPASLRGVAAIFSTDETSDHPASDPFSIR
jgi:hypothetical protein